jgi:hypothetical protein
MSSFKSPDYEIQTKISIVIDDYLRGKAEIFPRSIRIIVAYWDDSFCDFCGLLMKLLWIFSLIMLVIPLFSRILFFKRDGWFNKSSNSHILLQWPDFFDSITFHVTACHVSWATPAVVQHLPIPTEISFFQSLIFWAMNSDDGFNRLLRNWQPFLCILTFWCLRSIISDATSWCKNRQIGKQWFSRPQTCAVGPEGREIHQKLKDGWRCISCFRMFHIRSPSCISLLSDVLRLADRYQGLQMDFIEEL